MARRYSRRRNGNRFDGGEDINPMNYVANMSDAMLILAVGIMLALIVHWNVDVSTNLDGTPSEEAPSAQTDVAIDKDSAVTFEEEDMEQVDNNQDMSQGEGMDKLGEVYFDKASGKYYVVAKPGAGGDTTTQRDGTQ